MSRSYRKSPITGITTSESEKSEKRQWHKASRRAVRQNLLKSMEDPFFPDELFSSPWLMSKDGKQFFDPQEYPHLMRK